MSAVLVGAKARAELYHKFDIIAQTANGDKAMKLPFSVDRELPRPLVEQVVMGVKQAIDFGKYKVGDIIPATRDMAEMLGVSRIVTRQAVRRLADNGYLMPRPGVGCVVLSRGVKLWKGNVLLVMHGTKGYYYTNAFADELALLLAENGWRLVRVLTKKDYSLLDLEISHGADFALVMFENQEAVKRLRRAGIPFASIGLPVRGCVFHAHYRREAALEEAVGELKAAGVKTAWQVGFEPQPAELSVLERAGFVCREVVVPQERREGDFCATPPSALAWFSGVLQKGSPKLPDFIHFTDDGVCQGALLAFLLHGIRIPEDVKVMSWSNNGRGPYACGPIAYTYISTSENATAVAANLFAYLNKEKFSRVVELATRYVRA